MRRAVMAMAAVAAMACSVGVAPKSASAAGTTTAPVSAAHLFHPVQFYGAGPHWGGDGWELRHQWREWRRERDEARIAEAARREAWRIEREREERRAWRRAMR